MGFSELLKKAENTQEMNDWFTKRTKRHIGLVQKYCKKIYDYDSEKFEGLIERGEIHDQSKFKDPEIEPYILVAWDYKCKDDGVDPGFSEEDRDEMNQATEHHTSINRHHPEYWDK